MCGCTEDILGGCVQRCPRRNGLVGAARLPGGAPVDTRLGTVRYGRRNPDPYSLYYPLPPSNVSIGIGGGKSALPSILSASLMLGFCLTLE